MNAKIKEIENLIRKYDKSGNYKKSDDLKKFLKLSLR